MSRKVFKGKGAQFNPHNKFQFQQVDWEEEELYNRDRPNTQVFLERPKSLINKNNSPDIPFDYSMNPYQGCEHGCSYCYARTTHEFWGFSAGLDFESKIMIKENAQQLLRKRLNTKGWKGDPIMLSGNTDCYQPLEKKYQLTRQLLEICLEYGQPVSIITKNALISRDADLLEKMATKGLVIAILSITTADESLRRVMEPRTSTLARKLEVIRQFSEMGIPIGVNLAPIIPALNAYEIPNLIKLVAEAGAMDANYSTIRLNGTVAEVFHDWLTTHFPEREAKVWHAIEALHNGQVGDVQWGRRMSGSGQEAQLVRQLFHTAKRKYFSNRGLPALNTRAFNPRKMNSLFPD